MKYTVIAIYFVKQDPENPSLKVGKDVTSYLVPNRIKKSFDSISKSIIVHEIVDPATKKRIDPYPGVPKELIVIVENNETKEISHYTFPEAATGHHAVHVNIP